MSTPPSAPPLPPKSLSEGSDSRTGTPNPPTTFAPPSETDIFTPPILSTKSLSDLQYLLHSPSLLSALFTSTHPTSTASTIALSTSLTTNLHLAQRLQSLEHTLTHQREHTERRLLEARALERAWREKEKEMYQALQPFSPPALYNRLVAAVGEAGSVSEALEASFLEERGGVDGAGGRDVGEFLKEYRAVRKLYHLRRERKERWDDARVGGWR